MTNALSSLPFELLREIRSIVPLEKPIYLVGGAVRNALLGKTVYDLDFVLQDKALEVSRDIARRLHGAFFPLDEARDTGRVILEKDHHRRIVLDFAGLRGLDLRSDLEKRDFTINAIALSLGDLHQLIDPLGGLNDLKEKKLRVCSNNSFADDPVRVLRAIRLAVALKLTILPETRLKLSESLSGLSRISTERLRDELFRILDGPRPESAIRALDHLEVLPYILPELGDLKNLSQSAPHVLDTWEHSLATMNKLSRLLDVLAAPHPPESASNWTMGLASLKIGRYRQEFQDHLEKPLNPNRSLRSLNLLAALYHDIGKPQTRMTTSHDRVQFLDHEKVGARLAAQRARYLRVSSREIERLQAIVMHHMRPLFLAQIKGTLSRRAIYRFFRDTGEAGVDICLLSLADTLATYGPGLPHETWLHHLDIIRTLLEAFWEHPDTAVSPPPLLRGGDLIRAFNLEPGPQIGEIIEAIREQQATGNIRTFEQALAFASEWLKIQPG